MKSRFPSGPIVPGRYWHKMDDGRLQCDVCPRFCRLHDGQSGMCFVRQRQGEQIVLATYGRSSGFCVDPIEKKPLFHFLPGTPIFSFGTAGCNLACKFCQNWDISKSRETDTLADQASPEAIAKAAKNMGCRSVAFTYNDPTVFLEYAVDVAQACHEEGLKTVAVTAGYIEPEARVELYRHMDAANVDLKGFTEKFYHDVTNSHLQPVLDTLVYLKKETKCWFEITNLMIPGLNDSEKETDEMTSWIVQHLGPDVPVHFTGFHPDWKMRDTPATPPRTLIRAREIALKNGIHHAYVGNIAHVEGEDTFCATCKKKLIGRQRYEISSWHLKGNGQCPSCGTILPGLFESLPGHWGNRRLPVFMKKYERHVAAGTHGTGSL